MKVRNFFFLILMVVFLIFIFITSFLGSPSLKEGVGRNVENILKVSNLHIEQMLEERRGNLEVLAMNKDVLGVLSGDLVARDDIVASGLIEKGKIGAKEVNNYLKNHPEMTLEELKRDEVFRYLVLRDVGRGGRGGILSDMEKFDIEMHHFSEGVSVFDSGCEGNFTRFCAILAEFGLGESMASGFYSWQNPDGIWKEKYGGFFKIPTRTGDNKTLIYFVADYLDKYAFLDVSSEESYFFENFVNAKGYNNFLLFSPEGEVIYSLDGDKYFDIRVSSARADYGMLKSFLKVKRTNEISFYGPYLSEEEDSFLITGLSPVYAGEDLLGYVGIVENMSNFYGVLDKYSFDERIGRSYFLNENLLLLNNLSEGGDIFIQEIDTGLAKECFENRGVEVGETVDYQGNYILGGGVFIEDLNWCILTEVRYFEYLDRLIINRGILEKLFPVFVFVTAFFFFFFLRFFLPSKYVLRKKNRQEMKEFFDINFLKELSFFHSFIITSLFVFMIVVSFTFLELRFDFGYLVALLFSFFVISFLLFLSFSLKSDRKNFIIFGFLVLSFATLWSIYLIWHLNYFRDANVVWRAGGFFLEVIGVLVLLNYFGDVSK